MKWREQRRFNRDGEKNNVVEDNYQIYFLKFRRCDEENSVDLRIIRHP